MAWCEEHQVFYCFGLAVTIGSPSNLGAALSASEPRLERAKCRARARRFTEFEYSTLNSCTKARRVIGKAEILAQGDNPRFIVTKLPKEGWSDAVQATR